MRPGKRRARSTASPFPGRAKAPAQPPRRACCGTGRISTSWPEMTDPDLHAEAGERLDAAWNGDVFVLLFKPADDDPGYYVFQVNPAGKMIKTFVPQRRDGERLSARP